MISIRKNMNFSYWEREIWLKNIDFAIIGGGIVGLSSAYHIQLKHPNARVVIFERDFISAGASTRNAGFACYGSPTEILSDLRSQSKEQVFMTMARRWEGLALLKSYIPPSDMEFYQEDGFELFTQEDLKAWNELQEQLPFLNQEAERYIGFQPYSASSNQWGFHGVEGVMRIKGEGILHPGKMIRAWQKKCEQMGIEFRYGLNIERVLPEERTLVIRGINIQVKNMVICTNGFARQLMPELDVIPARNQVMVTQEILQEPWNQSFHCREGYVYLRSIGKRVLIGGGRDKFYEEESTDVIGPNQANVDYLKGTLERLLGRQDIEIDSQWSGIMGMGKSKGPIIQKLQEGVYVGVRMGGMGVAIGTWVGKTVGDLTE
jgi:glycine/D-amino acid oxidase-like deaminating enzyme